MDDGYSEWLDEIISDEEFDALTEIAFAEAARIAAVQMADNADETPSDDEIPF